MIKFNVPYKYWFIQYSNEPKENLFYVRCAGLIPVNVYRSIKRHSDSDIKNYLRNNIIDHDCFYNIVKSDSLGELLYNLKYHIGDVLLLENGHDARPEVMKKRILSITQRCLLGARENQNRIFSYLENGLNCKDFNYYGYDSVHVRDFAINYIETFA